MPRILLSTLLCWALGLSPLLAQLHNKGATVKIQSGAFVKAMVDIQNTDGGSLQNQGTLTTAQSLSNSTGATLSGNGAYHLGADWTNSATFTAGTSSVTFEGAQNSSATSGGSAFYNLDLNKSAGFHLALNDAMSIGSTLDFQAAGNHLLLGNFDLTLGTVTAAAADRFITTGGTGKVFKNVTAAFTFPVGFDKTTYNPLTLTQSGTPDALGVRCLENVFANGATGAPFTQNTADVSWDLMEQTPGGSNLALQFQWAGSDELAGFDRTMMSASRHNGANWVPAGGPGSASGSDPYQFLITGIAAPGIFALTNPCSLVDNTKPSFTCPAPTLVLHTTGGANCQVQIPDLVALVTDEADNCALRSTDPVEQSIAAANYAGVSDGMSIPVTVTVTDNATPANSETCVVTFTVNDNDAPTVTCPPNTTVINTDAGSTCQITIPNYVTMLSPTDNCSGSVAENQDVAAGAHSVSGDGATVTVNYTATDGATPANTTTCTVVITVNDDDFPTITCPSAQTVPTAPDNCSTPPVNYTVTTTDNCSSTLALVSGPPSGAVFPLGVNTVIWKTTDTGGNSTTCAFTVTVGDGQNPSIVCPPNISRNTDPNLCTAITTYATPTVSDNCSGWALTRTGGLAFGSAFPKAVNIVQWQVADVGGNVALCQFTVTVSDNQPPTITCPAAITRYVDPGACATVVAYANPTFSDNCPNAALSAGPISGPASGASLTKGAHQAIWQVAQEGGALMAQCTLNITVVDNQPPAIVCPPTQTRNTDPGQCAAFATYNNPTAADNCTPAPTATHVSGGTGTVQGATTSSATFPKGITTVQWKAVDGVGLTKTCTFRVIVNDLEAPTLTCSSPAPFNAAPGVCTAAVTYSNPTFADNCPPMSGTSVRISGPASGANFPVGNTNVVFQATDAAGNTKRCTMTVTVMDNQLPVINCPPPVVAAGSGTPCTATVFYNNPTASDNCASALVPFLLSGLASGSVFPAGVTTNTWRAIAPNGQTADCSFTVTVNCGALRGNGAENRETEGEANTTSPSHFLTFSLFPNPAAQEAWLDLSALEGLPCSVYQLDVRGALVRQYPAVETTAAGLFRLDLDGLPTGLYFVRVQVPGRVAEVLKLVVARR